MLINELLLDDFALEDTTLDEIALSELLLKEDNATEDDTLLDDAAIELFDEDLLETGALLNELFIALLVAGDELVAAAHKDPLTLGAPALPVA